MVVPLQFASHDKLSQGCPKNLQPKGLDKLSGWISLLYHECLAGNRKAILYISPHIALRVVSVIGPMTMHLSTSIYL